MADKLHKTKGIVLRAIKYGETSLVVSIFTELFGIQSYLVNGVRTNSKKGSGKANLFQPSAILDLIVYHNELKQLQRIREFKWSCLFQHIFSDIRKNSIALFMVELLTKCLKQPEPNPDLFAFCEDSFIYLDKAPGTVAANFPLFFALHVTVFFGVPPSPLRFDPGNEPVYFDLQEGEFSRQRPAHPHFIEGKHAIATAELLNTRQPNELENFNWNHEFRRELLHTYETYFSLHIQDFGKLRTLPILKEILA